MLVVLISSGRWGHSFSASRLLIIFVYSCPGILCAQFVCRAPFDSVNSWKDSNIKLLENQWREQFHGCLKRVFVFRRECCKSAMKRRYVYKHECKLFSRGWRDQQFYFQEQVGLSTEIACVQTARIYLYLHVSQFTHVPSN